MKHLTLQQFYQDRFSSDPINLLNTDEALSELSDEAMNAYIVWRDIAANIEPSRMGGKNGDKYQGKIPVTETKYKGRVAVYANLRTSDDGTFDYPTVNFVLKGSNVGGWSGLSLLVKLYKEHKGQITETDKIKWQQQNLEKRKALAKKQSLEKAESDRKELEKQNLNKKYLETYKQGKIEDGTQPYLVKKQIGDIASHVKLARCIEFDDTYIKDRKGEEFLSIKFNDIDGNYAFVQRIFADGTKRNSPGANFNNGAHCVIGDINNADIIYAGEGFATCASAFLATYKKDNVAVIVGISSGNLKKVLALYKDRYPELNITLLADNDKWKNQLGKGNAGMLLARYCVDQLNYKAVMPLLDDFVDPDKAIEKRETDFNDLHVLAGLSEVRRQLKARRNRVKSSAKNQFEQAIAALPYEKKGEHNDNHITRLCEKAVNAGVQLYPIHLERTQIIRAIYQATAHLHELIDKQKLFNHLVNRLDWLISLRIKNAQAFRSFSQSTLDKPHVNYLKIPVTRINQDVLEVIGNLSGSVVVRAPMGSGKTQHLISPLMANSHHAAYFAHRVSLISSSVENLNTSRRIKGTMLKALRIKSLAPLKQKYEMPFITPWPKPRKLNHSELVHNYQDFKGHGMGVFASDVLQMGLCINSVTKPSFQSLLNNLDISCIDEAAQTLRHIADGSAVHNPEAVYNALLNIIKNTKDKVILCDADANDEVIELCEQARPGETVNVIELDTDFSDIKIKYTDNGDQVFRQIHKAVEKGEKVLVANDSATNGKALYESLKEQFKAKKFLFIYQDSKGDEKVEAFNAAPDEESLKRQYDAVIYSPCISSGVSIESGYYTKNFAILCGTVAPSDAIQMIRRDRCAREFIIGFNKQNTQHPETPEEIIIGKVLADKTLNELRIDNGEASLKFNFTQFDSMRINVIAKQNKARNDFANNMLLILAGDKYQLERLAPDGVEKEVGNTLRNIGKEIALDNEIELQKSVETPDEATAERLRNDDCISERDRAQLQRFDIENQLCHEVNDETILFNLDRGIAKVKRFELIKATIEQAKLYELSESMNGVSFSDRSHKSAKVSLMHAVFKQLNISTETGEGEFSGEDMRRLRDLLLKDEQAIMLYNSSKIGGYIHPKTTKKKCETAFVKNILSKCGLELKAKIVGAKRKRVSFICPSSWNRMSNYYNARKAEGISSLEPLEYDTDGGGVSRSGLSLDHNIIMQVDRDKLNYHGLAQNALCSAVYGLIEGEDISFEQAMSWLTNEDIQKLTFGEYDLKEIAACKAYILWKIKYEERLLASG